MKSFFNRLILILPVLIIPSVSFALSPLTQYNDLVAGEGDPGFEDGAFHSAQFNNPLGLALNEDGSILYVADTENDRIRAVDLNNKNQVQTIAGTEKAGNLDGPISTATFTHPKSLAVLPNGQIAVNEGNYGGEIDIRLIDLASQKVTTLAGKGVGAAVKASLSEIWNMVYRPADNSLYFSEPGTGKIERLNLKDGLLETVLDNNPLLPHPEALCVVGDKLYGADRDLEMVYQITGLELKPMAPTVTAVPSAGSSPSSSIPVTLQEAGKAHKVIALAGIGDSLYAYDGEPVSQTSPIFRVFPNPGALSFGSVWGGVVAQASAILPHFFGVNPGQPVGFIADPRSEKRFFITNPAKCVVASFRDLYFGTLLSDGISMDFTYPKKKPFKTYRILMCGRSYIYFQDDRIWDGRKEPNGSPKILNVTTNIMMLMSKKLELYLNTLAALEDVPIHFEVLNDGRVLDSYVYTWPYYEEQKKVKQYDVDLVMLMMDPGETSLEQYEMAPLTAEGIPQEFKDTEFYLKPEKEKFKSGPMRGYCELLDKEKKEGKIRNGAPFVQILSDPPLRDFLSTAIGRPMALFKKKFDAGKTSWGTPCRLCLCYFPQATFLNFPSASVRTFWKEVAFKDDISYLDMTDDFQAFRYTYYPFSGLEGQDHFSKDGHTLFAQLLAYELINQKIIPFKTPLIP